MLAHFSSALAATGSPTSMPINIARPNTEATFVDDDARAPADSAVEWKLYCFWARLSGAGVVQGPSPYEEARWPYYPPNKSRSPQLSSSFGRGDSGTDIFELES